MTTTPAMSQVDDKLGILCDLYQVTDERVDFEGLAADDLSTLMSHVTVGNDVFDPLPDIDAFSQFLESYPFFRASGCICTEEADSPVGYITEVYYTPPAEKKLPLTVQETKELRQELVDNFGNASIIHMESNEYIVGYHVQPEING